MDILTQKRYKSFDYISRYSSCPTYYHRLDNKYIVGKDKWLDDTTPYTEYISEKGDTYDLLALRYYNNPTLFWVICSFNRIRDPYTNIKVGTTLKIPLLANIDFKD